MLTITRTFEIDAGHRLMKHESKCKNLHGHRYRVELTVAAEQEGALDEVGRIIDFGVIKDVFGGWLNETYDHGFIVEEGDPILPALDGTKYIVLGCPPSIENLVRIWHDGATTVLRVHGVRVVHTRAWETEKCYADYP